jgi:hypothetical protein
MAHVELNGDARDEPAGGKVMGFISSFIGTGLKVLTPRLEYDGNG